MPSSISPEQRQLVNMHAPEASIYRFCEPHGRDTLGCHMTGSKLLKRCYNRASTFWSNR